LRTADSFGTVHLDMAAIGWKAEWQVQEGQLQMLSLPDLCEHP